jgi:hypothetical protein
MSNFDRFSITRDVFPFGLRGLQCDAGARKAWTEDAQLGRVGLANVPQEG